MQNSEAMVSIDMPAGPSEVLVIADKHANPVYIASDLLSQVSQYNLLLKFNMMLFNICSKEGSHDSSVF